MHRYTNEELRQFIKDQTPVTDKNGDVYKIIDVTESGYFVAQSEDKIIISNEFYGDDGFSWNSSNEPPKMYKNILAYCRINGEETLAILYRADSGYEISGCLRDDDLIDRISVYKWMYIPNTDRVSNYKPTPDVGYFDQFYDRIATTEKGDIVWKGVDGEIRLSSQTPMRPACSAFDGAWVNVRDRIPSRNRLVLVSGDGLAIAQATNEGWKVKSPNRDFDIGSITKWFDAPLTQ